MKRMKKYLLFLFVSVLILILYFLKFSEVPYRNFYLDSGNVKNLSLKYILQWNKRTNIPFVYLDAGQEAFIKRNCEYSNCFVTDNKYYLSDYTDFDVILFHGPEVVRMKNRQLPLRRNLGQKYVFVSIESSDNYPVCNNQFDGFFNWTWTYKLTSDAMWGYLVIRDSNGTIVGPQSNIKWIEFKNMESVNEKIQNKLRRKKKAVAWFVSNCDSRSKRELKAKSLKAELEKFSLNLDIFGKCGDLKCCRTMCPPSENKCNSMIESDYYFYSAFENSFSEDYVTEKLLTALQNYAVPIVYGGANYSRFLPEGAYLNAKEMTTSELASKINNLMKNIEEYSKYFKWRNYYTYEDDNVFYCDFCKLLNNDSLLDETTVYHHFSKWWTPPNRC